MAKQIKSINDIDTNTTEGKLLIAAIGRLSSKPGYTNKTPDDILQEMVEIANSFD